MFKQPTIIELITLTHYEDKNIKQYIGLRQLCWNT